MILYFILGFCGVLSWFLSGLVSKTALKYGILDDPKSAPNRKKQKNPIPLLGGMGFILASTITIVILFLVSYFVNSTMSNSIQISTLNSGILPSLDNPDWTLLDAIHRLTNEGFRFFWILVSLIVLSFVGFLDDKYRLPAKWQILSILVYITISLLGAHLVVDQLSYPFNQLIPDIYILKFVLSFVWIFLCIAATKILDGLDGLVGLVGLVGFLIIASVSFLPTVAQSLPGVLALIWASSLLGFLPYNFPDAKLYLGEGGSEVIGFLLAIFSLWSGAKVATVSMGIGLFILDILLVVMLRLRQKRSPFDGDRLHWHHRLSDLGLSKVQILALTAIILVGFGAVSLSLETKFKIWLILSEVLVLLGLLLWSNYNRSL